jgi:hypothetical protein
MSDLRSVVRRILLLKSKVASGAPFTFAACASAVPLGARYRTPRFRLADSIGRRAKAPAEYLRKIVAGLQAYRTVHSLGRTTASFLPDRIRPFVKGPSVDQWFQI